MPKKTEEAGAPKWMVTFGDLMSLLLCFFVLLLSFSTMDPAMFKEVSGSLKEAFGVQREEYHPDLPKGLDIVSREFAATFNVDVLLEKIRSAIMLELIKGEIDIEALDDRVILRLDNEITFPPGRATLKPAARAYLDKIRRIIEEVPGEVLVAGHTDDVPLRGGRYPSNWSLSAARASSVVEYLLAKGTIAPNRMAATGYGPSRPRYPNDTPEHRAANRRVEIIFMQPTQLEDLEVAPITEKGFREQEMMPPLKPEG
ncbi:OmpA family protein [Dissulfurirhabdus thermomarina]|uniref:OmpA family protein n=1 Tax=Dissulfurirhabdus thermomarina TaxID=1765737 RepID=A0A6N9TPK8_DISTH|nr:OmpA family protein [Dissulfurirhabdus thermomarina]NDY42033.1 OmpA family protein [Dissulfurirhabdus thermomarina]NMX23058.1 OmpA family protein [Dissulfurirhabdus thermomarina]